MPDSLYRMEAKDKVRGRLEGNKMNRFRSDRLVMQSVLVQDTSCARIFDRL